MSKSVRDPESMSKAFGRVFAVAKRAEEGLSFGTREAIDRWKLANWTTGLLAKAMAGNGKSEIKSEIEEAFESVALILRVEFGEAVPLYRGQVRLKPSQVDADRQLFSWTSNLRMAKGFAHGSKLYVPITDEQIEAAVAQYSRTGFVAIGGHKYMRCPDSPEYFNIYDYYNNNITDGYDLGEVLRSEQAFQRKMYEEQIQGGAVVTDEVPVDAIVWVTCPRLQKEFITRWDPIARQSTIIGQPHAPLVEDEPEAAAPGM